MYSGPVYHENCDCLQEDSSAWMEAMSCPQAIPQIQRDLSHFPVVDPDKIAKEIPQRFGQRQSLCHYTIKDNKVCSVGKTCIKVAKLAILLKYF